MTDKTTIGTVAMGDTEANLPTEALRAAMLEYNYSLDGKHFGATERIIRAYLAALSARPAQEPVAIGWPKIMYVCERCYENAPEMCGKDRSDISVMPDGRWICNDCTHEEYDGETLLPDAPLLYAAPQPVLSQPEVKAVALAADAYVAESGIEHSGGIIESAFEAGARWAVQDAGSPYGYVFGGCTFLRKGSPLVTDHVMAQSLPVFLQPAKDVIETYKEVMHRKLNADSSIAALEGSTDEG